ncbi:MAG: hypothetical protein CME62_07975 [Halobacteriovoraceae bacterium]|nr:hypothetical protein [Halobacteriovoraceae bacterium]|tara:strand:+ start:7400 stop:7828 length:429 start_codon:yes stop_codon:yes gene_type:complete
MKIFIKLTLLLSFLFNGIVFAQDKPMSPGKLFDMRYQETVKTNKKFLIGMIKFTAHRSQLSELSVLDEICKSGDLHPRGGGRDAQTCESLVQKAREARSVEKAIQDYKVDPIRFGEWGVEPLGHDLITQMAKIIDNKWLYIK